MPTLSKEASILGMEIILMGPNLIGAPGVTRTPGTRIRNPLLYPPELQGHLLLTL